MRNNIKNMELIDIFTIFESEKIGTLERITLATRKMHLNEKLRKLY